MHMQVSETRVLHPVINLSSDLAHVVAVPHRQEEDHLLFAKAVARGCPRLALWTWLLDVAI